MKKKFILASMMIMVGGLLACGEGDEQPQKQEQSSSGTNTDKKDVVDDNTDDDSRSDAVSDDENTDDDGQSDADSDDENTDDDGQSDADSDDENTDDDSLSDAVSDDENTDDDGQSDVDIHNNGVCDPEDLVPTECNGRTLIYTYLDPICKEVRKSNNESCLSYKYAPVEGADDTITLAGTCSVESGVPQCVVENKPCSEDKVPTIKCIANHTVSYNSTCGGLERIKVTEGCENQ